MPIAMQSYSFTGTGLDGTPRGGGVGGRGAQRERRGQGRVREQRLQSGPAPGVGPGGEVGAPQAQDVEHDQVRGPGMGGRECAVAAAVGQALLQPNASRSPFHTTSSPSRPVSPGSCASAASRIYGNAAVMSVPCRERSSTRPSAYRATWAR